MVKASASRAEDEGFESRWRRDFSESSHTSDPKIGIPVAVLPGAWRYRVSAGTGRPGVSILWLDEVESLICNFYLSVAARKIVWADPSLRYTSLLPGRLASKQATSKSGPFTLDSGILGGTLPCQSQGVTGWVFRLVVRVSVYHVCVKMGQPNSSYYLSVAAREIVKVHPSLKYTCVLVDVTQPPKETLQIWSVVTLQIWSVVTLQIWSVVTLQIWSVVTLQIWSVVTPMWYVSTSPVLMTRVLCFSWSQVCCVDPRCVVLTPGVLCWPQVYCVDPRCVVDWPQVCCVDPRLVVFQLTQWVVFQLTPGVLCFSWPQVFCVSADPRCVVFQLTPGVLCFSWPQVCCVSADPR